MAGPFSQLMAETDTKEAPLGAGAAFISATLAASPTMRWRLA